MSKITEQDFLFAAEDTVTSVIAKPSLEPWQILVVDDDAEVHTVTTLALNDLQVFNRTLTFHHAYNGEEAIQYLKKRPDIAVVLLDVVMESDDAGLIVVQRIREELQLDEIRIVLRTGQPGYAPEEKVIKQYDINDYKTKTELTRGKLVTAIIGAIRSYQQIRTINQSRRGLEKIINSAANLLEHQSLHSFSEGVLTQISSLLGLPAEGIVCAQIEDDGSASDRVYVLGAAGAYAPFIKCLLERIQDAEIIQQIRQCLYDKKHLLYPQATVLYLGNKQYNAAVYLQTNQPISELDQQLIELFLSNISIGYQNAALFQQLKHTAYIDALTKMPNRNAFINLLQQIRQGEAEHSAVALIDIKHFSDINDGLGHDVGNEFLIAVAMRLNEHFVLPAQLARVDTDVFAVIGHSDIVSPDAINAAFIQPFLVAGHRLQLRVNVGFCRLQDTDSQALSILKSVTIALNRAKKSLTSSHQYYLPEMAQQLSSRLTLLRKLGQDFAQHKLQLWYQPQVSLQTKQIVGVEALLRWPQDNGDFISPATFIPLAEYSGLIIEIGDWVIQQACMQIKQLSQLGFRIRIAVNVSMQQFRSPNFVQSVMDNINHYQIDAKQLEIEITESIVMDEPQTVIKALQQLKAIGVNIAIDDFGMGFSSLSYIQKLPLDRIKIDRAFVANMVNEVSVAKSSDQVLVETIIRLGKKLQLVTIAEGVEDAAQQQALIALGCDEMQGYFFAKPMPATELTRLLQQKIAANKIS
ncbi:bifunctional diguanylate cyclase/phosphodiesterase [Rheinheimera salexigens]|uniref:Diguanylate phosphodiesterase n=1 Tax=Rheinheimera salexigens TaxID=1628148 RepID=A0A1E7Q4H0_9GAMM|nr:EAL domain-containing protein [Rheinheimera salexigens]OEY69037.1 diguanylate phosphodiesterase [Rheinheimera salexigens]